MKNPVGHGNAGLASNFVDLAHCKVRPGGCIAFVLPLSALSGGSWHEVRKLLATGYRDVTAVTLAAEGNTDSAFSADTGMGETLIVATRIRPNQKPSPIALFANLLRRPANLSESSEVARAIHSATANSGKLLLGDRQIVGSYVRAPLDEGGAAALREERIADAMLALRKGRLRLPRMNAMDLPATKLGDSAARGWSTGISTA